MVRIAFTDKKADVAAIKMQEMEQVADIIEMAKQAEPTELLALKAGLDAAFGDRWREFKPLPRPLMSQKPDI
jgi:hypothetical protein